MACKLDLDLCHVGIEQAFGQSDLEEHVLIYLPQVCGGFSWKIGRFNESPYGLKQASSQLHAHLTGNVRLRCFFLQFLVDA